MAKVGEEMRDTYIGPDGAKLGRVVIANRGEIASRIIRTCRLLGVTSIALYTVQDASTRFWREADESFLLGDIEKDGNPYLDIGRIIAAAKQARADAVHPGYGYLSENAAFAKAVVDAGLIWIGPRAETIDILGDKAACKRFLSERAKHVPLVPGITPSRDEDTDALAEQAALVGFPILLKAAAGGGGKGMRVVSSIEEFAPSLAMARGEAKRNFGSDEVLVEKYVACGKHVEVQVFGDAHGGAVYFGDRDCSVQRRHQKVIEESPAIVSDKLKSTMKEAALEICRLTKYENAATVEFIVDVIEEKAYFLEVNTRIQVEHPVTEEVWGIDLIALQLHVAAGGRLSDLPETLHPEGHSIQCRLYAESPRDKFLPQRGPVTLWAESKLPNVRYESSVRTGDDVTIFFDPMIAKIIVYTADRSSAVRQARRVIESTVCLGLVTNQQFLASCLAHPVFGDASYTTALIGEHLEALNAAPDYTTGAVIVSAITHCCRTQQQRPRERSRLTVRQPEVVTTPVGRSVLLQHGGGRDSSDSSYHMKLRSLPAESDDGPLGDAQLAAKIRKDDVALNKLGAVLVRRFYDAQQTDAGTPDETVHVEIIDFDRTPLPAPHADFSATTSRSVRRQHEGDVVKLRLRLSSANATDRAAVGRTITALATVHTGSAAPGGGGGGGDDGQDLGGAPPSTTVHLDGYGTYVRSSALTYFGRLDRPAALGELSALTGGTDGTASDAGLGGGSDRLKAPMPGRVVRIEATSGSAVTRGQGVVVLESMKTEVRIVSRIAGKVTIHVAEGDAVEEGKVLATVEKTDVAE